jgi:tetratricopeptide (TPR) repeat protein
MFTATRIQRLFAAAALAGAFAACEDLSTKPRKTTPPVSVEAPKPVPPPEPVLPTVVTPTPSTEAQIAKEIVKENGVDDDVIEDAKPADAIAAARKRLESGDLEGAFKFAKVGVTKSPKRSAAWNTLGRVHLQMGKRKDAITSFEKAVELNPRNSFAQNNLGLSLIYEKRYEEAIDALELAVDLDPVEGYMWNNLGMAYEHLDRLSEARDAYTKAAELENDRARESLARLDGVKTIMRTAKVDTTETPTARQ